MKRICSNCGQAVLTDKRQQYTNLRYVSRNADLFGWLSVSRPLSFCDNDCLSAWLQRVKGEQK